MRARALAEVVTIARTSVGTRALTVLLRWICRVMLSKRMRETGELVARMTPARHVVTAMSGHGWCARNPWALTRPKIAARTMRVLLQASDVRSA